MITMMGSMGAYMKNLKLKTQVEMKQSRGELGNHKSLSEYLDATKAGNEDGKNKSDDRLRDIHNKILQGGKLTPDERRYLQSKDPEAFQKLRASEQEQKAFERKLRQCRTKEEAQRLKMTYINSSLTTIKSVENNSAIPKEKKLEIFMQEKQRCDRIEASCKEFERSGEYDRLPSEAEEAKAHEDAQRAEEEQRTQAPEEEGGPAAKEEPAEGPGDGPKEEDSPEKPAIHVESREEKKVKKARANAGRGTLYFQAVTAYQASLLPQEAAGPKVDMKG